VLAEFGVALRKALITLDDKCPLCVDVTTESTFRCSPAIHQMSPKEAIVVVVFVIIDDDCKSQ
jgi:hypothetical protein